MKRKRVKSIAAIPMSVTAQALIDMAMAVEANNPKSIKQARDALNRLHIQIYIGEPLPELAPQDIKLATIPQLIGELRRRCVGLAACALNVVAAEEQWYTTIKGSPQLICTAFNQLGNRIQQSQKPGSDGHEPATTRVQDL